MSDTKTVYMDYAAMTPIDDRVVAEMQPYYGNEYGNPSSIHLHGRNARAAIDKARESIADILNCKDSEIIFTGGGTESDNLAIMGITKLSQLTTYNLQLTTKKPHIITTTIEHHAVLNCCKELEKEGYEVTYVKVDESGVVKAHDVAAAIKDNTVLVSVMYANNEVGTIQPVAEIGELIKNENLRRRKIRQDTRYKIQDTSKFAPQIYYHTDACQAAGYLDMDVETLGVDLLSMNGSKVYGPQGIGILYVKKGLQIKPLVYGGEQELGIRPGTENTPAIVGLASAFEIAQEEKESENKRLASLREIMISGIKSKIKHIRINGDMKNRLPGNLNISVEGIEGEAITLMLDEAGISVSTGSACTSNALEPSHVLLAMGVSDEVAHGSLRISLGRFTKKDNVDYFVETLPEIVKKLRDMSPMIMED